MNTQNNWKIGLTLSLVTVMFWATLSVALDVGVQVLDEWTFTWFRFFVAAILTLLFIAKTGSWRAFKNLNKTQWGWLSLAGLMLIANYILFLLGLDRTSPGNAQVLIQLAPLLMTLGGVLIYKERFNAMQMVGVILLISGMGLFFNEQIQQLADPKYMDGVIIIIFSAISWAIYALIQKKLLSVLTPQSILAFIYVLASFFLFPFSHPEKLYHLNSDQWIAVAYSALNTVGAYAAFAEALKHWQASRVGMVIATTPVLTVLFVNFMSQVLPQYVEAEKIMVLGWIGIFMIVAGSMFASLSKN